MKTGINDKIPLYNRMRSRGANRPELSAFNSIESDSNMEARPPPRRMAASMLTNYNTDETFEGATALPT